MNDLLVLLSIGHSGRPDVPHGVGAFHDGIYELDLIWNYAQACRLALRGWGVACWPLSDGTLSERQHRAIQHAERWLHEHPEGRVLYVACHVNAGGGRYGAVFYDARSSLGKRAAEALRSPLERFPELSRVITRATPGEEPERPWSNAHATIRHVFDGPDEMCAVCYEPFFINAPDDQHKPLTYGGGLNQVGMALAEGILGWAREERA